MIVPSPNKVSLPAPVATDLVTIGDLANRYGKSDRHIRRIIALPGFPEPFRVGAIGRRLHWHFGDILEWESQQKNSTESSCIDHGNGDDSQIPG